MNRNALGTVMWVALGVMAGIVTERMTDPLIAYGIGSVVLITCYILIVLLDWSGKERKF